MAMPTEEQMAQSLLEAREVTIEELRREREKWRDACASAWASETRALGEVAAITRAKVLGYRVAAAYIVIAFAIGLLLGVGL